MDNFPSPRPTPNNPVPQRQPQAQPYQPQPQQQPPIPQRPDDLMAPMPPDPTPTPSGGKGKKVIVSLLCLVLVAAAGASAYLLKQEKDQVAQLNNQVAATQTELNSLKAANETQPAEPAKTENPETVYSAKVGKFTITLPGSYTVIQQLDGPFEGGPATDISIGTKSDNQGLVISNVEPAQMKIEAVPNSSKAYTFAKWLKEKTPTDTYKKAGTMKVGDKTGQLYKKSGLIASQVLFVENNKIFYTFEVPDYGDGKAQKNLEMLVKGFKFN